MEPPNQGSGRPGQQALPGQTPVEPTKTLWIRPEYLRLILSRRKTVEVRVGYPNIVRLRPGDLLLLNDCHAFRIARISAYKDFGALLQAEDASAIAPDLSPEQLLQALRSIYSPEKEALGVYAIHLSSPAHDGNGIHL